MDYNIKNQEVYVSRMNTTLVDKCWWLEQVPEDIHTIIDFGCAEGDLYYMIKALGTKSYQYIGIDNNTEMVKKCTEKGLICVGSMEEAIGLFNPNHTLLVMNSVVHEILHYGWSTDFTHLFRHGIKCVAIRDMVVEHTITENYNEIIDTILNSKYRKQFEEVDRIAKTKFEGLYVVPVKEFLLKYRYKENWERESNEQYLWAWPELVIHTDIPYNYDITYMSYFNIPFIRNQIKQDFGFDYDKMTHCKMFLIHK